MKKILIILLAILCIPVSTFAITLSTLQNNPDRYLKVDEDSTAAMYLDTYSVKSIRYSPPYYTLSAKTYFVLYPYDYISLCTQTFNYDYNYSMHSTLTRIVSDMNQNGEALDDDVIISRAQTAVQENSGITYSMTYLASWKFNGQLLKEPASEPISDDATYPERPYWMAQAVFKTYHNQDF